MVKMTIDDEITELIYTDERGDHSGKYHTIISNNPEFIDFLQAETVTGNGNFYSISSEKFSFLCRLINSGVIDDTHVN